jgi:DNA modification methylase
MRGKEPSIAAKFAERDRLMASDSERVRTTHRVLLGDSRRLAGILGERSVELVVTSPPYWDLKRYGDDHDGAQLGHVADRDQFLRELNLVWRACYDALVPGGRMCVVVGDVCRSRKEHGRHVVEPLHAFLQVECQRLGFDPLAPIIWSKIANMATEVEGNGAGFLGKPYEPNAIIKNDIEFILLFRKPGGYRHPTAEQRLRSLIEKEDHKQWFQQIWSDVPGEVQRGHPAPFPAEVARRLIGMFSFVGDTVLDPFAGTGNTVAAAMEMGRSSIGVELEPRYFELAKRRLHAPPLGATVEFCEWGPV